MNRSAVAGAAALLAVIAVANVVVWASRSDGSDASPWSSTHRALCAAAERADAGKVAAARRIFYDGAHEPLHELARRVQKKDRKQAARLLERKERVETSLERPTDQLSDQLRSLARSTRAASATVGERIASHCSASA